MSGPLVGLKREKSGEIEESRERDVEGVEVSRVYRERKKILCSSSRLIFFFLIVYKCILMTKSGLMTLRELRCHVCIEREKKSRAIESCATVAG
jgi:hypothetical protein